MKEPVRPLWAPWRVEFIRSPKPGECFLCIPPEAEEDYDKEHLIVRRGRHCFVILNKYPYNSGHLLIAPFKHVGDISLLDKEELAELMGLCVESKEALAKAMAPEGFNVGLNLGKAAGAGVEQHLHMHVVPRWTGDTNFMPVISNTRVVPEALEDTAAMLRKNWH
ncbi:MAG: HIT domain-containing protein [Victivallales bacterium]|nr:HIT domain-containing protein [Victivallales bacterium]